MATYTTKAGDVWDAIAYAQLGSVNYTDRLMNLNRQYRDIYSFSFGHCADAAGAGDEDQ